MREKVAIDILIFYLKMMYDAEKKGVDQMNQVVVEETSFEEVLSEIEENSKYKGIPGIHKWIW